jgi:intein-encoded DNA endonuclease-like protein
MFLMVTTLKKEIEMLLKIAFMYYTTFEHSFLDHKMKTTFDRLEMDVDVANHHLFSA